jgi:ketosteroid isomerase-like protein
MNETEGSGSMSSTQEVVDHHLDCFGKGDMDGILADYSSTAVLITPQGPLKGAAALRTFYQAVFAEFGKPGTSLSITQRFADGDYAYILWTAETADNAYEMATDTFVVRNGQIVRNPSPGRSRHNADTAPHCCSLSHR